ncbi:MAG: hypothetical protein Q8835_03170 [Sweet potato little leaf phytoplasma]|nr:hypothetical protein [Sweet potato little leaf phytoplasma]
MSDPPGVRFELDPEIERTFRIRRREQRRNQMENVPHLPKGPEGPADPQNRLLQQNPLLGQNEQHAENPILIANDRTRAIRAYFVSMFNELNPGIARPQIQAANFEMKPVMFQMLQTVG